MSKFPTVPSADLDLLRQFDTPTVCNVIELFDVQPRTAGYMDHRIQACFPKMPPMVGYASTATFRSAFAPRTGDVYSGLTEQVASFAELPGPPVVVFQDLDSPAVSATFGEVMCSTYKAFGSAGLITSGAGRDLLQVEALNYPCFTGSTICSHGYCHILQIGVQVHVGGILVKPGDLLHGDANGVTTIPIGIASAVAQACPEFVKAEEAVMGYVKGGKVDAAGFAAAHKECRRLIDELAKKVRRGR